MTSPWFTKGQGPPTSDTLEENRPTLHQKKKKSNQSNYRLS